MELLYILIVVLIGLITVGLLFRKKNIQYPEIIIFGPAFSGKTKLFYMVIQNQLTENKSLNTVSSLRPNSVKITANSKEVMITDYPGNNYYREQLLTKLPFCLGMIFIVDSTDKLSFKKAAEELYELLSLRLPKKILIFCNKQDQPYAKKILMIESELSTEMQKSHRERLKIVKENDIGDVKREKIGKIGSRFEFSQMLDDGVIVEFAEGSVLNDQIQEVKSFIEKVTK